MSIDDAKVLLPFAMLFMHTIADYRTQGCLADLKQKSFWQANCPDEMYKYDYIMALFMHSFQWTFMMTLPGVVYWLIYTEFDATAYLLIIVANTLVHMVIDHAKANCHLLNLVTDQVCHLIQMAMTLAIFLG